MNRSKTCLKANVLHRLAYVTTPQKITNEDFCMLHGLRTSTLLRIQHGENVSLNVLDKWADALGVETWELLQNKGAIK